MTALSAALEPRAVILSEAKDLALASELRSHEVSAAFPAGWLPAMENWF